MLEWPRRPRIQLVEASEALRLELARAVESAGFEVDAVGEASAPDCCAQDRRHALHVIDLAAPGASHWLEAPEAATRALFLEVGSSASPVAPGEGPNEVDRLRKPFSIEALEARIRARIEALDGEAWFRLEPLLQTKDPRLVRLFERARQVARRDCAVAIVGELGTGRRALARAIHARSPRAAEPILLLEGEAASPRTAEGPELEIARLVARAARGTLLVCEPDELSPRRQSALQSALRASEALGAPRCLTLARTPLEESVRDGRLSAELAYRLFGATLVLPPLRVRRVDQGEVCRAVARRVARELGLPAPVVDDALVERLAREGFPGNRAGLETRLRSALIRGEGLGSPADDALAQPAPLRAAAATAAPAASPPTFDLRTLERETIVRALDHASGNRTHASRALGISVRTLRNKIHEYGLR
jgi:DNA-binding NtrC family response regulator